MHAPRGQGSHQCQRPGGPGRGLGRAAALAGLGGALAVAVAAMLPSIAAAATPAEELLDADLAPAWQAAHAGVRAAAFAGVLVAAGGAIFFVWAQPSNAAGRRRAARLVVIAALVGLVATLARVPLQAVDAAGSGAALTDLAAWQRALGGRLGLSLATAVVALAVLLAAAARARAPAARGLAAAAGVVAVGSLVLTGHSATSEPRWLALTATFGHNIAAAVWAGGLVALAVLLTRPVEEPTALAATVRRFSQLATGAILAVAVAGLAVAWVQVRAWSALTATGYGQLLVAKGALVAAVAVIGAYNHRRLVPAVARQPSTGLARLRRTVGAEVIGLALAVAVTGVLVSAVPARIEAGIGQLFAGYADLDAEHRAHLVVDPNQVGTNELHVWTLDATGQPVDLAETVALRLVPPEGEDAAVELSPRRAGPGHFIHVGGEINASGSWRIEVRVPEPDGGAAHATFTVTPGQGTAPG